MDPDACPSEPEESESWDLEKFPKNNDLFVLEHPIQQMIVPL